MFDLDQHPSFLASTTACDLMSFPTCLSLLCPSGFKEFAPWLGHAIKLDIITLGVKLLTTMTVSKRMKTFKSSERYILSPPGISVIS